MVAWADVNFSTSDLSAPEGSTASSLLAASPTSRSDWVKALQCLSRAFGSLPRSRTFFHSCTWVLNADSNSFAANALPLAVRTVVA